MVASRRLCLTACGELRRLKSNILYCIVYCIDNNRRGIGTLICSIRNDKCEMLIKIDCTAFQELTEVQQLEFSFK